MKNASGFHALQIRRHLHSTLECNSSTTRVIDFDNLRLEAISHPKYVNSSRRLRLETQSPACLNHPSLTMCQVFHKQNLLL